MSWNLRHQVQRSNRQTIGVSPARIAKTLSFRGEGDHAILIVAAGDAKIDNKKFRHTFGFKARMLSPDEVPEQTGHEIGEFVHSDWLMIWMCISMSQ